MTDAAPVAGSSYRKLRYALMASLALNVLVIGAVAGTFASSVRARAGRVQRAAVCSASLIHCRASAPI